MKEIICAQGAPAAIGPYSHAVRTGGFLFTSGQIALDPACGKLAGDDIESQTRQVLRNLESVLSAAGMGFEDVVKATIFLTDLHDFETVNKLYGERFRSAPPARSCIQAAKLPAGAKVEIELIAYRRQA